jgi:hypothetical protein
MEQRTTYRFDLLRQRRSIGQYMWFSRLHEWISRLRQAIEGLSPYQSLALLAVPISVAEPMKMVAVALAGEGHWLTGAAVIVAAYGASLLVVERLFMVVKPKLLQLHWFARLWARLVVLRYRLKIAFTAG